MKAAFLNLLKEMVTILEQPEPPEAGEKCEFCQYREKARLNQFVNKRICQGT